MKMAAQKSCPSFGSIISVLSIVLYCGGFLRVELELNKQRKRIDALETDTQVKPSPRDPDITKIVMNSPENLGNGIHRNRRQVYRTKNETENKQTSGEGLKTDHLLSDLRLKLCQSNVVKCSAGPPGPPGPPGPRGEKGVRGRRGQKGRTGNKGNNGIMGSPGKSGKQGPKGEIGPEGQKGETGTEGMPGAKGSKGVMGSPGGSGKQGIMGLPGTKGKIGPKGQKGEIGTEGMPGAKGSKGVMGSPGRSGKQGNIGLLGPKGEPGPKGEKGVTGTQGMPGAKGSKGVMGSPGRSGKQGSMGLTGLKGEPGPKGEKGGTGTTGLLRSSSILNSLDSKYACELSSFLGPVLRNPSRSMFVRCWRAKTDGWYAFNFHRNCDAKGPTVTIIKVGSYIFGGYTDVSWSSSRDKVNDRIMASSNSANTDQKRSEF
ncbi:otolin-1-like [Montipora capricornis]|uniref:otolin-1-like n=1 Tax=Montipora capricornis TaxID=246305 RepID=UPI0035F121CE